MMSTTDSTPPAFVPALLIPHCDVIEDILNRERLAGREPDPRSWSALATCRRFAAGTANHEELARAWDASMLAARDEDKRCDQAQADAWRLQGHQMASTSPLSDADKAAYEMAMATYAGRKAAAIAARSVNIVGPLVLDVASEYAEWSAEARARAEASLQASATTWRSRQALRDEAKADAAARYAAMLTPRN